MVRKVSNELKQTPGYDPRYRGLFRCLQVTLVLTTSMNAAFAQRAGRLFEGTRCGLPSRKGRKQTEMVRIGAFVRRFVARRFSRRIAGSLCWSGAPPAKTLGI